MSLQGHGPDHGDVALAWKVHRAREFTGGRKHSSDWQSLTRPKIGCFHPDQKAHKAGRRSHYARHVAGSRHLNLKSLRGIGLVSDSADFIYHLANGWVHDAVNP